MKDNILDSLIYGTDDPIKQEEILENTHIPEKCSKCRQSTVCSIVPGLMAISKLDIILEIKSCIYFTDLISKKKI